MSRRPYAVAGHVTTATPGGPYSALCGRGGCTAAPGAASDALLRALGSRAAAATAGPATVYMDVPEHNVAAVALAERRGMARSFATARMYTRGPPVATGLLPARVFGLTSLELG